MKSPWGEGSAALLIRNVGINIQPDWADLIERSLIVIKDYFEIDLIHQED